MAKEIERKFFLGDLSIVNIAYDNESMEQGYLAFGSFVVRVRTSWGQNHPEKAWLTLKGPSSGMSCDEFEYEIPMKDAEEMLSTEGVCTILKTRYYVQYNGYKVEIDRYRGPLSGLYIVEVEFPDEETAKNFVVPEWFDKELTGMKEWSNASLAINGLPEDF